MSVFVSLKRMVRSGFIGFWRNAFVSIASIFVMIVTLFVIGGVIFLSQLLNASLEHIQDKVDINVYFTTTATEEEVLSMQRSLEGLPEVDEVRYTSRDDALQSFRERHQGDELTIQAIDELGDNPLGASLSIRAQETSQYEGIASFLEAQRDVADPNANIIDRINYAQNKTAIDRLTSIINAVERFGVIVMIVLVIASILITFNTIRLAIYTAREEISVMRLVGASNAFIRGPFVLQGIMYGLIAGIITLIVFYPLTLWLGPVTENFFLLNIFHYYVNNFGSVFLVIVGSGIVLGAISSALAIARHLRV